MFAIWLSQTNQLSGAQVGILFSCNSIAAVSMQPLLGFMQDKLQRGQQLLWLNCCFLLGTGPFFSFVYSPLLQSQFYLGAILGAFYIALVFLAMAGVVEAYIERLSRLSNFEYGQVRLWGSLGWAAAAFFSGALINKGGEVIFWAATIAAVVPMLILGLLGFEMPESKATHDQTRIKFDDVKTVFKLKKFYYLTIYVLGVATIYTVYDQQFPVFYASIFASVEEGNQMYGYLNSMQIFLEAGGFFLAPLIVNRIGVKTSLLLAGGIMTIRIFGSGLFDGQISLSLIKLLHAAELPILMVAIFKYINFHFDNRLSSTLFLLSFMFVMQCGAAALAPIFGSLYDTWSFQPVYLLMASIATVFLFISAFALENDAKRM